MFGMKITMQQRINIIYKNSPTSRIFRFFYKSPLAVIGILFVLIWLFFVATMAIKVTWDYYYPYEGRVLKIESRWYDHILFEFTTWEHLIIETPDGEPIDKLVSMEIRLPNRIETGDYVIKGKGFRNTVRPRDKKTNQEILQQWKSLRKK
jgi:hypothetical protein